MCRRLPILMGDSDTNQPYEQRTSSSCGGSLTQYQGGPEQIQCSFSTSRFMLGNQSSKKIDSDTKTKIYVGLININPKDILLEKKSHNTVNCNCNLREQYKPFLGFRICDILGVIFSSKKKRQLQNAKHCQLGQIRSLVRSKAVTKDFTIKSLL